jgi:hypothetical protein
MDPFKGLVLGSEWTGMDQTLGLNLFVSLIFPEVVQNRRRDQVSDGNKVGMTQSYLEKASALPIAHAATPMRPWGT